MIINNVIFMVCHKHCHNHHQHNMRHSHHACRRHHHTTQRQRTSPAHRQVWSRTMWISAYSSSSRSTSSPSSVNNIKRETSIEVGAASSPLLDKLLQNPSNKHKNSLRRTPALFFRFYDWWRQHKIRLVVNTHGDDGGDDDGDGHDNDDYDSHVCIHVCKRARKRVCSSRVAHV